MDADTVDLGNLARSVRRGWRLVAGFAVAGLALGFALAKILPRRFDGTSTILLRAADNGKSSLLSQVQGVAGGLVGGAASPMETELAILSSQSVAGQVVDSLRLQAQVKHPKGLATNSVVADLAFPGEFAPQVYHFERQRASGSATTTYSYRSSLDSGTIVPGNPQRLRAGALTLVNAATLPPQFDLVVTDRDDAISALTAQLNVDKDKGEVAKVQFRAKDSLTAARVPNLLVAIYMARRQTTDRGVDQRRVEFLSQKLDSLNGALAQRTDALRRQQEASGVIDPDVVGRLELQRAGDLRASLSSLQVEHAAAQRLIDGVESHRISPRQLAAFPTFLKSSGINSLLSQLTDVDSRRDALLGTRTEKDPEVQGLDSASRDLEAQLLPLTRTYAASTADQASQVKASLDSLEGSIAGLPRTSETAGRLQRDVLDLSKLSAGVQAQLVDAKLAAIGEGGDVHPLDPATVPRLAAFPNPVMTIGGGLALGLCGGIIAALMLGSFGRWMEDPLQLERTTGVPALRFDPSAPLLVRGSQWKSILVAPVDDHAHTDRIIDRLRATALASGLSTAVLDLTATSASAARLTNGLERRTSVESGERSAPGGEVNAEIAALEQDHDLVIVKLAGLLTDNAAAALRDNRPVLLVTGDRRVERSRLLGAVQILKRLDVPCAGIVMNGTKAFAGATAGV